jgi:hypothetical protein
MDGFALIPGAKVGRRGIWVFLKIQISDGTTSHSTRLSKDDSQVAGYKPDQACAKKRSAAYK